MGIVRSVALESERDEHRPQESDHRSKLVDEAYSRSGQEHFRKHGGHHHQQHRSDSNFLPAVEIIDSEYAGPMVEGSISNQGNSVRRDAPVAKANDLATLDKTGQDASSLVRQVESARGQTSHTGDAPVVEDTPAPLADRPATKASPEAASGEQATSGIEKGIQKLVNTWTGTDPTDTSAAVSQPSPTAAAPRASADAISTAY
jgi:hypothetical protein